MTAPLLELTPTQKEQMQSELASMRAQLTRQTSENEALLRRLMYHSGYELIDAHLMTMHELVLRKLHAAAALGESLAKDIQTSIDSRSLVAEPIGTCGCCFKPIFWKFEGCKSDGGRRHVICMPCFADMRFELPRQCGRCLLVADCVADQTK